jgi:signal transduction histidine kinase
MLPIVEVVAGPPVLLALVVTCLVAQVYRFLRWSGPVQRQQTKWVLFGFAAAFGGFTLRTLAKAWVMESTPPGATWVLVDLLTGPLLVGGLLMVPVSLAFAIVRYRLWDIDILINRALVYGTLSALVATLYVLIVMGLGALVRLEGNLLLSLLATALVAVLIQPLRTWLQRAVNRLMYGHRDEPYEVLARLGRSLEDTLTPEEVLPRIVETVAQALKLPYAAIALKDGDTFRLKASHGQAQAGTTGLPLVFRGETVGELRLAPRAPGESFTPADMRLMNDLCRQAGVAAYTVRITTDLQRSREWLVTAREEERRRIRRDLHDGLGPVLASLTLKADTARNLLEEQPAVAAGLLNEIKAQSQAAVGDIRRLVYELRPPALDDLGLLSALREHIAQLNEASGIAVLFDAPEPEQLPPLSAAVEVAAYRIVLEALTNVVRHSGARACAVRLKEDAGLLCIEVADDGQGLPSGYRAGVGLASIRERAVELGGTCIIERRPEGGTRILARIALLRE